MAFDSDTRNLLARIVGECRQILVQDVEAQLQSRFGLYPDGRVLAIAQTADEQQAAQELKELLDHLAANEPAQGKKKVENAYSRLVREIGFTLLNRLAALRLGEERGIVIECVGHGMSSAGFQLYDRIANGALGNRYETYRAFLEGLFDELAIDLGVLFDRDTPHSHVFPSEAALSEVLERLNDAGLEERDVWRQDETIGWIYQYYNDPDERRAMRKASSAPRNSRELAVRNQFFTPRYVVEFLTDNTLGRLWYEMRRGETRLAQQCRYLVRRPNEVFLSDEYLGGWSEPIRDGIKQVVTGNFDDLPRDVRWDEFQCLALMIDGYEVAEHLWGDQWEEKARGFFDRYEEEGSWQGNSLELWLSLFFLQRSWRSASALPDEQTLKQLADLYTSWRQAIQAELAGEDDQETADRPVYIPVRRPKDPRAIKILDPAGGSGHFSLYAFDLLLTIYEEGWEQSSPDQADSLRSSYPTLEELQRSLPALILRHNLHSIDIDPRATQIAALALWLRAQRHYQSLGLSAKERPQITRSNFVTAEPMPGDTVLLEEFIQSLDVADLGQLVRFVFHQMKLAGEAGSLLKVEQDLREEIDNFQKKRDPFQTKGIDYWLDAESKVVRALGRYVGRVTNGQITKRLLFAEDALAGLAFVDLCRQLYDVILMNPPFGAVSIPSRIHLYRSIKSSSQDLFAAFVERFSAMLEPNGRMGIISSRLALYKELLSDWRHEILLGGTSEIKTVADLGYGVLDAAVVEAAAYVVARTEHSNLKQPAVFLSVLDADAKPLALLDAIRSLQSGARSPRFFIHEIRSFATLPGRGIAYWCSERWLRRVSGWKSAADKGLIAKKGLETGDDFRYLRLVWEVPNLELVPFKRWTPYSKGGEYRPLHSDVHLVFDWQMFQLARRISNNGLYGQAGLTYTERTTSSFAARILPEKSLFSPAGPGVFYHKPELLWGLLAFLNSSVVGFYLELFVGGGDTSAPGTAARHFSPSIIERIPVPPNLEELLLRLSSGTRASYLLLQPFRHGETSSDFILEPIRGKSLKDWTAQRFDEYEAAVLRTIEHFRNVDVLVQEFYQLNNEEREDLARVFGQIPENDLLTRELINKKVVDAFTTENGLADRPDLGYGQGGLGRAATKLSYIADRRYENLAMLLGTSPRNVARVRQETGTLPPSEYVNTVHSTVSLLIGFLFGRWDIRHVVGEESLVSHPFSPHSAYARAMLVGDDGSPPSTTPQGYPIRIADDGIIADDTRLNEDKLHPTDIVERTRKALEFLWPNDAQTIEVEICEALSVGTLRDYFRSRHSGFFAVHLQRYSRSRRKAPIYWPLSTATSSYTLWIYYHRLTEETLYTAVNNYVEPKIQQLERHLAGLEGDLTQTFGREATEVRDEIDSIRTFLAELREFRDELLRVAALPYKPNLNDGVIINAAPLHKLFPHRGWQQDTEKVWRALEAGEYDWSHMAYHIWPERVREACRRDKSIAIAHGLEALYEEASQESPGKRRVAGNQMALDLDEDE